MEMEKEGTATVVFKPVIKELIQYYYDDLENSTGGYCHIALDDGNVEDGYLWWCREECRKHGDHFGRFIMEVLREFTVEERERMYEKDWWGMRREP